ATYDYMNDKGDLLYQVVRLEPKSFRQRRPDGKGGWIWNLNGCRRVPYRLPEIIAYPDAPIVLTEGEKDSDRGASLGMLCTTVGRDNMAEDCLKYFAGRDVWIVRDMDRAGAARAHKRASALHGVAATVRVVELPGLDGTPGKKDLTDWFNLDPGNTPDKLAEVALNTPLWTRETAPAPAATTTTAAPPRRCRSGSRYRARNLSPASPRPTTSLSAGCSDGLSTRSPPPQATARPLSRC